MEPVVEDAAEEVAGHGSYEDEGDDGIRNAVVFGELEVVLVLSSLPSMNR
jgi:hypothetical protein